ncbi:unnamed protein product [Citrullus colocynthis]|uniref:Uncharacterized protein n=1 Tax=Citrullus colocynthis TaxID=252529 RepID=A0ABP0YD12_9ROSI
MAYSTTAFIAKVVFFALLLLTFDVSARDLVDKTNTVTWIPRKTGMEAKGVNGRSRRLIARKLDGAWRGNYASIGLRSLQTQMASTKAFFASCKIVFIALLLLAFKVSARELNVMAGIARETAVEMNDVKEMRLFDQVLDSGWNGNYHPPNKFKDEP